MGLANLIINHRCDYKRPNFTVRHAELFVWLDYESTRVRARLHIERLDDNSREVKLHGDRLDLESVKFNNGDVLPATMGAEAGYTLKDAYNEPGVTLNIPTGDLNEFIVEVTSVCHPAKNTELTGLYQSGRLLSSFNSPMGMRRICFYIDRPDVLATFTVHLEGEKAKFPLMMTNGVVKQMESDLPGGRHAVTYHDPIAKPSYIFAIVAGELVGIHGEYQTLDNRIIKLRIMSEPPFAKLLDWALECLKRAMKFDEEEFGRIYELDTYTIVGVSDFNMGAMENKGLNLFNISNLTALPDRTADQKYQEILAVIGHEYFHNWSGNRVTIRDWFQLTLKEGLTQCRAELFQETCYNAKAVRIQKVRELRRLQFREDANFMSHSIRPEAYRTVENMYTATVYGKGAQVVRMYRTLLGKGGFRSGCDLYFDTFDGTAATCDDLRYCLSKANFRPLGQFERWYSQRRTPVLTVTWRHWDSDDRIYYIKIKQALPKDANYDKPPEPLLIPIRVGLVKRHITGKYVEPDYIPERVLELRDWEQEFAFQRIHEPVVPSVLRGFSAPVILEDFLTLDELAHLTEYDTDGFNRWESMQRIYTHAVLQVLRGEKPTDSSTSALDTAIQCLRRIFAKSCLPTFSKNSETATASSEKQRSVANREVNPRRAASDLAYSSAFAGAASSGNHVDGCLMEPFLSKPVTGWTSRGLLAELITLPSVEDICSAHLGLHPYFVEAALEQIRREIANCLSQELSQMHNFVTEDLVGDDQSDQSAEACDARSLRNALRLMLAWRDKVPRVTLIQLLSGLIDNKFPNFTERLGAARILLQLRLKDSDDGDNRSSGSENEHQVSSQLLSEWQSRVLNHFYETCTDENSKDMWFTLQALCSREDCLDNIKQLASTHVDFVGSARPNRIRSLILAMTNNPRVFHHPSGAGYKYLADCLVNWDDFNSALAVRAAKLLTEFRQFSPQVQAAMHAACVRVCCDFPRLSTRTREILMSGVEQSPETGLQRSR